MSCLQKLFFILLFIGFFTLGGYSFVKEVITNYQNPTREQFVQYEADFGDFSKVSSNYQLTRSFNFFGYRKINAIYLPTGQKITIFDLRDEDKISPSDFYTKEIDTKIESILDKTKSSIITLENYEAIQKGRYSSLGKFVPYIVFKAKVKNVPFKNVIGTIGAYSTVNKKSKKASTKLIFTSVDTKAYNPRIVQDLIQAVRF